MYTTKKQNPLKNIAKCKFYDDAHHAKFQRVFRHLKATPFLAQSKNRLPRQHHHRTVCPPNRQSLRAQKRLFLKGQAGIHLSPYAAFLCRESYGRTEVAHFVFPIFGRQNVRLTLDRTTWEYGKSCINILVLAVVWRGVAIPVLWEALDKKGNYNTGERMVLLELFREAFPEVHIETLYADWEFIGDKWLAYLRQAGISYCIRCKENAQIVGRGYGMKDILSCTKGSGYKKTGLMSGFFLFPCRLQVLDDFADAFQREAHGLLFVANEGRNLQDVAFFDAGFDVAF